jgi:NADH-quinone oxidoreductase subunit N
MAPTIEYQLLLPVIVVFGVAVMGIGAEALVVRRLRFVVQVVLTSAAIAAALLFTIRNWMDGDARTIAAVGAIAVDNPALAAWVLLLVGAAGVLVVATERISNGGISAFAAQAAVPPGSPEENTAENLRAEQTEIFPLFLFSLSGMMVLVAASNLISAFVGLEVMSLPLYLLVGLARRNRLLSHEAALKYFLLGVSASAVFLYGMALLFGFAGSFDYASIATAIAAPHSDDTLLYLGTALTASGLLFKLGVFPFHAWMPDVYTGAPTAITAYLATCGKITAAYALLRLLFVPLGALRWSWQLPLTVAAVVSIAFGAVAGLTQNDVKRGLAYTGIAHAGFLLLPIAAAATVHTGESVSDLGSVSVLLFYLVAYLPATLGTFALTLWVHGADGPDADLASWRGLAYREPFVALAMGVLLLSLIGLPGTGGFTTKLLVLVLAWRNGMAWAVFAALAFTLVTAGFYFRVLQAMFLKAPLTACPAVPHSKPMSVLVVLCVIITVYLGLFPTQAGYLIADMAGLLR